MSRLSQMPRLPKFRVPERLRKVFAWSGYAAYFFGSCLLFSYCTFPYERARDFLESKVSEQIPGAQLRVVSLTPRWFTGVEATGVQLRVPAATPDARPTTLTLRRLYARVQILPLLMGTKRVNFEVELDNGGHANGSVAQSSEQDYIDLELANVDLRSLGPVRNAIGLPVAGVLNGTLRVALHEVAEQTEGAVDLTIRGLSAGDGRSQISIPSPFGAPMALTIDELHAGDVRIRGPIARGQLTIEEFSGQSDDLELRGRGTIRLLRNLRLSSADLLLRANIKPAYRTRSDRTQAIFSLVESNPLAANFRASDGAFQLRLQGALFRLVAVGAGAASIP